MSIVTHVYRTDIMIHKRAIDKIFFFLNHIETKVKWGSAKAEILRSRSQRATEMTNGLRLCRFHYFARGRERRDYLAENLSRAGCPGSYFVNLR